MAKIDLGKVHDLNKEVTEKKRGFNYLKKQDRIDVRETIEGNLNEFGAGLMRVRKGLAEDGGQVVPQNMSFRKALQAAYGIDDENQFLEIFDINQDDSFRKVALKFGVDNINHVQMEDFMIGHSNFSNPMTTGDIDTTYRFIIPEIFTNAIRIGYEHSSRHRNWISGVTNMSTHKLTMPQILRGDAMPSKINEGANIPLGSVQYGRKDVTIFKIGIGLKLTDEIIWDSTLNHLNIFLGMSGNDMAIGADSQAFLVLANGEQADLSESAPEIGVLNTSAGFTYKDLKKVFTRGSFLNQPYSRIIAGEDDTVDITGIDKFEGFQGQSKIASISSIVGVPEKFDMDVYVPGTNKIMFLDPTKAMTKLQYRSMMSERRRNPQNGTEEFYMSDHINFAILKRDARVFQNKSLDFATNGFPSYMDVATRIAESYKTV